MMSLESHDTLHPPEECNAMFSLDWTAQVVAACFECQLIEIVYKSVSERVSILVLSIW